MLFITSSDNHKYDYPMRYYIHRLTFNIYNSLPDFVIGKSLIYIYIYSKTVTKDLRLNTNIQKLKGSNFT